MPTSCIQLLKAQYLLDHSNKHKMLTITRSQLPDQKLIQAPPKTTLEMLSDLFESIGNGDDDVTEQERLEMYEYELQFPIEIEQ